MERRRYIGRANADYVKTFSSKTIRIDEADLKGYAALIAMDEMHRPFVVGDLCLCDRGYSELVFLPDGRHWAVTAIYDDRSEVVEWYFDIIRKNAVDEAGEPYKDDLYLDAALMPDGRVVILDEDELKDALDRGAITRGEFDIAYDTLREIEHKKILDVDFMQTLCRRLKVLLQWKS